MVKSIRYFSHQTVGFHPESAYDTDSPGILWVRMRELRRLSWRQLKMSYAASPEPGSGRHRLRSPEARPQMVCVAFRRRES